MHSMLKCGLSAALGALLLVSPAAAADPLASGDFAQVTISAGETDFPQQTLTLDLYQRDGSTSFTHVEEMDYSTPVNRVTKDLEFCLESQTEGVTLWVDYLTDLNQDGIYELVSGEETPVGDVLSAAGELVSATSGVDTTLAVGKSYCLTGDALLERGEAVLQERTTQGSATYLPLVNEGQQADSVLYMMTVRYHSHQDQTDYEQCYYLHLYDQLPLPSAADYQDVSRDAWYYDSVDYVLSRELLTGTTRNTFSPMGTLSRAMLAQILHNLAGNPDQGLTHFTDVPQDAWSYAAVTWAVDSGILSAATSTTFEPDRPLTREELALALFRFAQELALDTSAVGNLGSFADQDQISDWARPAMRWAVAQGVFTGRGGQVQTIDPKGTVTRAEFSAILKTLYESVLPQSE